MIFGCIDNEVKVNCLDCNFTIFFMSFCRVPCRQCGVKRIHFMLKVHSFIQLRRNEEGDLNEEQVMNNN